MNQYVEVEFKANRRDIYFNAEEYPLQVNDYVILQADKGVDIGRVYRLLDNESVCTEHEGIFEVLRKASEKDLKQLEDNRIKEENAKPIAKQLFKKHELDMRLTDFIKFQVENSFKKGLPPTCIFIIEALKQVHDTGECGRRIAFKRWPF